jgi:hypothetical protein
LSATQVRRRMAMDKDWQSLVSHTTAEFIVMLNGVDRVKSLFQQNNLSSQINRHQHR